MDLKRLNIVIPSLRDIFCVFKLWEYLWIILVFLFLENFRKFFFYEKKEKKILQSTYLLNFRTIVSIWSKNLLLISWSNDTL